MDQEAEKIKSYFLGTLPAAEAEEMELRLISDAEFDATLIAVENELVEDHLDNALSKEDAHNFNENYLATEERVKNLETVALLREYARTKALAVAEPDKTENVSMLDKIRNLFSGIPTVAYAAVFLLVIGTAVIYIWLGRGSANERLQAEYTSLNRGDLSDIDKFKTLPQITAVPGSLRGSGSNLTIAGDGSVFVRLALVDLKDQAAFNVSLMQGQTRLLKLESIRVYDSGGNREIRLLLPAKLLEKGTYQLTAAPRDKIDSPITYTFTVE